MAERGRPIVTLLTDFGVRDAYVGAMKGAVLAQAPEASVVDLCHEVPAYDVRRAALLLRQAFTSFPAGTVHVAVVDPGVGGPRAPVAVEAGGQRFVGPDNGVLWPSVAAAGGGVARRLPVPAGASRTFHGRDVFAPAAGRLAAGRLRFRELEPYPALTPLVLPAPAELEPGRILGHVLWCDGFGNVVTDFAERDFAGRLRPGAFRLRVGRRVVAELRESYGAGPAGRAFCIWGSAGLLEISVREASAARALGFARKGGPWPPLRLELAPSA